MEHSQWQIVLVLIQLLGVHTGLRKRCKTNKQKGPKSQTTHYLIWKQNKGVVCSCTSLKLQLGLYCNSLWVHRVHVRLWAVGFLADDSAASRGSWGLGGGSVQGCACSGISIQCKEVVTEVAVNCCCVGKGWGLLCKQVSSALFQFKVKTSRCNWWKVLVQLMFGVKREEGETRRKISIRICT